MMKTKQDNNMTDRTSAVYTINEIELSWLIRPGVVTDENQIGQWCDQIYRCSLRWKRYWIVKTDWIGCWLWWKLDRITTWLIVKKWSMLKMKLSYSDWLNQVWSMSKTKQDNDVNDSIDLVYAKIKTQLSLPIWLDAVCDENKTG